MWAAPGNLGVHHGNQLSRGLHTTPLTLMLLNPRLWLWGPGGASPASPLHSLHVPRRHCSPPESGPLPGDPGAGQSCLGPPCTPHAQPCPPPAAGGSQNSRPPLCSAGRSEAVPGSRDLEGEGMGGAGGKGERRRRGPSIGAPRAWQPRLLMGHEVGSHPVRGRAGETLAHSGLHPVTANHGYHRDSEWLPRR